MSKNIVNSLPTSYAVKYKSNVGNTTILKHYFRTIIVFLY